MESPDRPEGPMRPNNPTCPPPLPTPTPIQSFQQSCITQDATTMLRAAYTLSNMRQLTDNVEVPVSIFLQIFLVILLTCSVLLYKSNIQHPLPSFSPSNWQGKLRKL